MHTSSLEHTELTRRCIIPRFNGSRVSYFDISILSRTVIDFRCAHVCFARIYLQSEHAIPHTLCANIEHKVGELERPAAAARSSSRQVNVIKTTGDSMYRNKILSHKR